jgi:hypothetical protein
LEIATGCPSMSSVISGAFGTAAGYAEPS